MHINPIHIEDKPETIVLDFFFDRSNKKKRKLIDLTHEECIDLIAHYVDSHARVKHHFNELKNCKIDSIKTILERLEDAIEIVSADQM